MNSDIEVIHEFTWKIQNFKKEVLQNYENDKSLFSKTFSIFLGANETKWYFCLSFSENICELYLYLDESEVDDFNVKFEAFVFKLTNEKVFNDYLHKNSKDFSDYGYGFGDFFLINEMFLNADQFLKENTLTLGLKIELSKASKPKHANIKCCSQQYLKMCENYFDTKTLSDFTIICSDGVEIEAHKMILAGFSPVMEAMIIGKMVESKNNSVHIKDINSETMTEILRFIYTAQVNNIKDLAVQLLHGAEKYALDVLKKLCVESMIENLSVENVLEYFLLADKYYSNALLFHSAVFIKLNYDELRNKDWGKFTKKHLFTLLDNYQNIPGEVTIFNSTL